MLKFKKGYTYLVKCSQYWYVVQQQSQRGWDAVIFSHHIYAIQDHIPKYLHGNAESLVQTFTALDEGATYILTLGNDDLRKKLFKILKTGSPEGWELL